MGFLELAQKRALDESIDLYNAIYY